MSSSELVGPPLIKNDKHRRFADLVLAGKSQTQAALELGYAPNTCGVRGAKIAKLPHVQAYIHWMRSNSSADVQDIRARIDEELRDLAFANIGDLTRVDANGQLVPDFSAATRTQLKAVTGVSNKVSKRYDPKGNLIGEEHQSRFGFIDKVKATELLGKLHGLFKENELKVTVDVADRLLAARRRVAQLPED